MSAQASDRPIIVAFGDSITYGYTLPREATWVHRLGELMIDHLGKSTSPVLVNAGVNGNTSREGLARIEQDVLAHHPTLVLVEFGGNDTIAAPERHVGLEEFSENLRQIDRRVRAAGGSTVIVSFPPVVNEWHRNSGEAHYTADGGMDRYVQRYRDASRQIAAELGRPFYDLDRTIRDAAASSGWEALIERDGVHLTLACNELVARDLVEPIIDWLDA
jgi:lysophospholipase L1-like esterase